MTDATPELLSLVYTSTAAAPFRETALAHLLDESRARNESRGLTGLLLYRDMRFIQVLEGAPDIVRGLAASIARDTRHGDMRILIEEPIDERRFSEWTMGYRALKAGDDEAPSGFRDSFADLQDDDASSTLRALHELTLWFRMRSGELTGAPRG